MRRKWLGRLGAFLAVVGLVVGLIGCGGKQPGAPAKPAAGSADSGSDPQTKVEITFWHAMTQEHGKALDELIAGFQAANPNVVVETQAQGSYGELNQKLIAAIAANTQPTLTQLTDDTMALLWHSGHLQDLGLFIADPRIGMTAEEVKDIPESFLDATRFDGKQAALPFSKSTQVLIYDKALVPQPPQTWEEFRRIAKEATRDTNGDGKPETYGTVFPASVDYMDVFMAGNGGKWVSADGAKATFDGTEGQEALQFMVDMQRDGSALNMEPKTYQSNYFNEGRAAMIATTSASIPFIHQGSDGKRDWAVAPLFAGPKTRNTPFAGNNVGIFKAAGTAQQQAAWRFIKFLINTENTAKWAARTGYVPVRWSALESQAWKEFAAKDPKGALPATQLERGTFQPALPKWNAVRTEISAAVEAAVIQNTPPAKALAQAAQKANEILSKK